MRDQTKTEDIFLEVARGFMPRQRRPAAMAGPSSASGAGGDGDQTDVAFTNPMTDYGDMIEGGLHGTPERVPAGTAGQVLTAEDIGGVIRPRWHDPTLAGGMRYRQYVIVSDGSGGWGFLQATVAGQSAPVTALYDLEP